MQLWTAQIRRQQLRIYPSPAIRRPLRAFIGEGEDNLKGRGSLCGFAALGNGHANSVAPAQPGLDQPHLDRHVVLRDRSSQTYLQTTSAHVVHVVHLYHLSSHLKGCTTLHLVLLHRVPHRRPRSRGREPQAGQADNNGPVLKIRAATTVLVAKRVARLTFTRKFSLAINDSEK